jgi:hypothetical protein
MAPDVLISTNVKPAVITAVNSVSAQIFSFVMVKKDSHVNVKTDSTATASFAVMQMNVKTTMVRQLTFVAPTIRAKIVLAHTSAHARSDTKKRTVPV